jgi:topoisomerase-4 subunit A
VPVADPERDRLAAISSTGHLLVFPVAELPQLPRGKGNKILGIPAAKAANREEILCALAVVPPGVGLTIHSGKRHFTLKPADLDAYLGERGRRGNLLPRGFQRVDGACLAL